MSILNRLTLAHLKENKKRTFLTGLSISVIVALLTAIVIFVSSFWLLTYKTVVSQTGEWHFMTNPVTKSEAHDIAMTDFVESISTISSSIVTEDSGKQLNVLTKSVDKNILKYNYLVYKGDGRYPQSNDEIAVSQIFYDSSRSRGKLNTESILNSKITLSSANGITKTYTIVGIIRQWDDKTPVAIIPQDDFKANNVIVYGKVKKINQGIYNLFATHPNNNIKSAQFNGSLLGLFLVSNHSRLEMLTFFSTTALVILGIVLFISITVISSAFSLSLSERVKQLGALSSVGTTRRQITKMMLLEALWIGSVSIVIGLMIGYIGTAISLNVFNHILANSEILKIPFETVLFMPAILGVILFAASIILLSSLIPSVRAAKRSPIDNIKQVPFKQFLPLPKKKRRRNGKRSCLTRVFGTSAFLATQYQKHNRSRSRVVFMTLTISLITFNVITNLVFAVTDYSSSSVVAGGNPYSIENSTDIVLKQTSKVELSTTLNHVKGLSGVTSTYGLHSIPSDIIVQNKTISDYNQGNSYVNVISLSESEEAELLKQANISKEEFKTKGVYVSYTYRAYMFDNYGKDLGSKRIPAIKTGTFKNQTAPLFKWREETPLPQSPQDNNSESETNQQNTTTTQENSTTNSYIPAGYITIANNIEGEKLSFGLPSNHALIVSKEKMEEIVSKNKLSAFVESIIAVKTQESDIEKVYKTLQEKYPDSYVHSQKLSRRTIFQILSIAQILSYGFITLIAIICLTTLYNTMSSNIRLRRREFSILRSIGITTKQIRRMLTIENLKTGTLALIVAIILSIVITIYFAHSMNVDFGQKTLSDYPILPTAISSVVFIGVLTVFNRLTIRQSSHYSLVEDIKNETL